LFLSVARGPFYRLLSPNRLSLAASFSTHASLYRECSSSLRASRFVRTLLSSSPPISELPIPSLASIFSEQPPRAELSQFCGISPFEERLYISPLPLLLPSIIAPLPGLINRKSTLQCRHGTSFFMTFSSDVSGKKRPWNVLPSRNLTVFCHGVPSQSDRCCFSLPT